MAGRRKGAVPARLLGVTGRTNCKSEAGHEGAGTKAPFVPGFDGQLEPPACMQRREGEAQRNAGPGGTKAVVPPPFSATARKLCPQSAAINKTAGTASRASLIPNDSFSGLKLELL